MFRATICPSSGETTVFILYGWQSGMHPAYQLSSTQNNKYQVLHRYSCFSWWWAHSRPKHVEKRNILKKLCTNLALFTRLFKDAGPQNIKKCAILFVESVVTQGYMDWYLIFSESITYIYIYIYISSYIYIYLYLPARSLYSPQERSALTKIKISRLSRKPSLLHMW